MSFLVRLLKRIGKVFVVLVLVAFGLPLLLQFALPYLESPEWEWGWHVHQEEKDIEIKFNESRGRSVLRKVFGDGDHIVYAWKDDDYNLITQVTFLVDCEPGKKIDTGESYSDGEPMVLTCSSSGKRLRYATKWDGAASDVVLEEDFGGFFVYVNFWDWDFSALDREITLANAE